MADGRTTVPNTLVRGPLKYSVETSSPQIEAGKNFSVSVRITNPYDVPVAIRRVVTKLPAKFLAVHPSDPQSFRAQAKATIIAVSEQHSLQPLLGPIGGQVVQASDGGGGPRTDDEVPLQPGNSTVRVFTVRTSSAMLFVPSLYNLNIEVEYVIDDNVNHDTVAYQMNVRAPLGAIITGAVIGAIIGYLVRAALDDKILAELLQAASGSLMLIQFIIRLVTSVFIAGIVVVAFARKKDAQPILSIEDFWGGLFIGFLSAYGGQSLLNKVSATA